MTESNNDKCKIILLVQGGAGDVFAHTPMVRYFRKKYPDDEIIVLSTYSQLWEGNPNVDVVLPLRSVEDFYSTHIVEKKVRFMKKHFVYDAIMDEVSYDCKTLPEFICKLYGAEYDGNHLDYYISTQERKIVETFVNQYRPLNKPIVLLHCTGAIPSDGNFNKTNKLKDLDTKKISTLVKKYSDKLLFIQIGLNGEPLVEGAIDALGMPMREAIALIDYANSYIFIESLFAHASNALQKRGVVVFQNTSPFFFGYDNNVNVHFSGECKLWPCNRPVGALIDVAPGYKNPKTRDKLLWDCPNQVCAQMPLEQLEAALLQSLQPPQQETLPMVPVAPYKGNAELDQLRDLKPALPFTSRIQANA